MTNTKFRIACFGALASMPACGTAFSRVDTMFGAYPFQAVVFDGYFISKTFNAPEEFMGMMAPGPLFLVWGLVSLPIDLAIDLVALPIDVGAWIMGEHKYREHPMSSQEAKQANSGSGVDAAQPAAAADAPQAARG